MEYLGLFMLILMILAGVIAITLCLVAKGINNAGDAMDDSFCWGGRDSEDT